MCHPAATSGAVPISLPEFKRRKHEKHRKVGKRRWTP
nr:MAG TPA: hypothetical protein [Siphoviridae sp. ct3Ju16]